MILGGHASPWLSSHAVERADVDKIYSLGRRPTALRTAVGRRSLSASDLPVRHLVAHAGSSDHPLAEPVDEGPPANEAVRRVIGMSRVIGRAESYWEAESGPEVVVKAAVEAAEVMEPTVMSLRIGWSSA
jgi:hypothetical protein